MIELLDKWPHNYFIKKNLYKIIMSNQCGCGNESNVFTEKEVETKVRKTEKPELLKK